MDPNTINALKGAAGAAGAGGAKYVEEVFSSDIWRGNDTARDITNGIDLDGEGGLVWIKAHVSSKDHSLSDTVNLAGKSLTTNATDALTATTQRLTAFNDDGFSLGTDDIVNGNGNNYAGWTFRKAPGFFDIVQYTGDGEAGHEIPHDLGCKPGFIVVKKTNDSKDWPVYHKSLDGGSLAYLLLNRDYSENNDVGIWNYSAPTSTHFKVGDGNDTNEDGETYIAYLFADGDDADAKIWGDNEDEMIVKCGFYTGTGSGSDMVANIGFEPQWMLVKNTDQSTSADWTIWDTKNRWYAKNHSAIDAYAFRANLDASSGSLNKFHINSSGFETHVEGSNFVNGSGDKMAYVAIRRGKMKKPEAGTEVFQALAFSGNAADTQRDLDIEPDAIWQMRRNGGTPYWHDRVRHGEIYLSTWGSSTEGGNHHATGGIYQWGSDFLRMGSDGHINGTSNNFIYHIFTRARGFFDIVSWTGNGTSNLGVAHNLGVTPEFAMVHTRGSGDHWYAYHKDLGNTKYFAPSGNDGVSETSAGNIWGTSSHDEDTFYVGSWDAVNHTSKPMIMYLWASLDGVSKVGNYDGSSTSADVTVSTGFQPRYIMIKRTDTTGDWYIWDSTRGLNAGAEVYIKMNTGDGDSDGTDDYIDVDSDGFTVAGGQIDALNASDAAANYVYLAIA